MKLLSRISPRHLLTHSDVGQLGPEGGRVISRDIGHAGATGAPLPEPADSGEAEGADGVYAIIKNTNYWFNRELYGVEQEAKEQAARWAEKGLPHHAAPRDEPLPVEQALGARCTEIFREWAERVRTKMQDAIERAGQDVAQRMVALRFTLKQLENAQLDLRLKEREAAELRESLRERETPFGYKAFIGKKQAFALLALMALVEFIANFPVFRILLPMNAAVSQASEKLSRQVIDYGLLTGLYSFVQDLLFRPEALAVSLVVVVTVVVLGDSFGESLRPVCPLKEKENPAAAVGIRSHRRQHLIRVALSFIGVVCSLAFLFEARQQIPETAQARVLAASGSLASIDSAFRQASVQRSSTIGSLQLRRDDAERTLALRQEEASYAQTVQRSNWPILFLNVALLLGAAVIGYSKKSEDLKDQLSEDPRYTEVRSAINALRHEALQHRQSVREAAAEVRVGISRVHHLLSARPLQEWRAKADRLHGVIPLFRSENARLRSLDPVEILAFQSVSAIDFPHVDEVPFRAPVGFERYAEEFEELNEHFARLSRQLHITDEEEAVA